MAVSGFAETVSKFVEQTLYYEIPDDYPRTDARNRHIVQH